MTNAPVRKLHDEQFPYIHNTRPALCRVRIYETVALGRVVIISELAINPGISVTNAISEVIACIAEQFNLPADDVLWIEHYGPNSYTPGTMSDHIFDMVSRGASPIWERLPVDMLVDALGEEVLK
jgi:hypothetical protein